MNNGRLLFFNLVKAMREAQREYFSTRSHEALQKARSLERSVDAYIKRGDDYLKRQNQEPTLFDNEDNIKLLYIDLFCGAGGTSTGVEKATFHGDKCAKVIACVNHDANAIASHAANHPDALHYTEDIRTLDLTSLVMHTMHMRLSHPYAHLVLWASLECTNFSKAKGGMPRDADSRTLAEHLFRYIEALRPDYIQIENVEEFMSWGDMDENGHPISKDKGKSYVRWVNNVCKYGYYFDWRILNAADYGAYTSRKRFFGQFALHGLPIAFPKATHAKCPAKYEHSLFPADNMQPWKPVREVLDLNDEGESIFGRKRPLVEKTLERIYAGLIKFVAGGKEAFIVKWNSVNGKTGKYVPPSIDEPCPTVATQNRLGVAKVQFLSKQFGGDPAGKNISVEEPAGTITCRDHHAFVSAHYGNGYNTSVDAPAPTLTCKDRLGLVTSNFLEMQYGNGTPASTDEPAPAVTTNPKHNLVSVKPWIMNTNYGNVGSSIDEPSQTITANRKWHYLMNPQFANKGGSIDKPCFTLIARMDKMPPYLVSTKEGLAIEVYETDSPATIQIKEFMALYGIADIRMRMLRIPELKRIMGFPEDYTLIGTQAEQKKFIGNAVEVNMARVLCEALCKKLNQKGTSSMKILELPLKKEWYNMIESGDKPEEYRAIKPYWSKRFVGVDKPLFSHRYGYQHANVKGYTHVRFRYGYTKRTMLYKIDEITIGRGNPNWGAPTDKDVFIIKFHEYEKRN